MEKHKVAINTPLPKAIMVVINLSGSFTKSETRQPISRGLEETKPNSNDSNMP
jgi:hypothetical protein